MSLQAEIGARVKATRKALRMTQAKVGAALGVDQSQFSRMERGESPWTALQIATVADLLGVTAADLMPGGRLPTAEELQILVLIRDEERTEAARVLLETVRRLSGR